MRRSTDRGTRQSKPTVDLEEVRPHIFRIHEPGVTSILKGEGEVKGQRFELTSWRREGLMARLRDRGFQVRTLADQVEALPNPPRGGRIGGEVTRPLATTIERFSYFDPLALTWVPVEPQEQDGQRVVTLRDGWVVRRRKGRGSADYYVVLAERTGGAALRPIEESKALLIGYGQATGVRERDMTARRLEKAYIVPDLVLPAPYRTMLSRIGEHTKEGWRIHERGWPLVQELFAKLGILLRAIDATPEPTPPRQPKSTGPKGKGRR